MLTSSARETLSQVETVIVDEVHAVAGTKRGSHLALSLERLDARLAKPAQRIGLSATVRPPQAVADFPRRCRRAAASSTRRSEDLRTAHRRTRRRHGQHSRRPAGDDGDDALSPTAGSIWPAIERSIADEILANRATIVFANSRRFAERLTAALNELYARRLGYEAGTHATPEPRRQPVVDHHRRYPAIPIDAPVLARAHHGSVSKEQRAQIEDDLKTGNLRCVVATSSLELGIDMGAVDLVVQVESPPSVASGLQRVGRAGHQVGEISRGILYPGHRTDLIHTTVAAARMRDGLSRSCRSRPIRSTCSRSRRSPRPLLTTSTSTSGTTPSVAPRRTENWAATSSKPPSTWCRAASRRKSSRSCAPASPGIAWRALSPGGAVRCGWP